MKLIPELLSENFFTLLTAPIAKGKTKLVLDFYFENPCRIVFVSPLRALANEVYLKLNQHKGTFLFGGEVAKDEVCLNFLQKRKAFLVTTIELLEEDFLEAITNSTVPTFFVLDEFHLFYHWGEDFRPILHDRFLAILDTGSPVLAITATMNTLAINKLKLDLLFHHDFWIRLDYGNQQLHQKPTMIKCFDSHSKRKLERAFIREMRQKEPEDIFLFFCSYRSEVFDKVAWAKRMGFRALGCIGGEVESFLEDLEKSESKIDCIFSTTTLSHGVNLPEIKKIFINYEVKDYDFWLQMIGRGGRRGSEYQVYCMDQFNQTKSDLLKNRISIFLQDFIGVEW